MHDGNREVTGVAPLPGSHRGSKNKRFRYSVESVEHQIRHDLAYQRRHAESRFEPAIRNKVSVFAAGGGQAKAPWCASAVECLPIASERARLPSPEADEPPLRAGRQVFRPFR